MLVLIVFKTTPRYFVDGLFFIGFRLGPPESIGFHLIMIFIFSGLLLISIHGHPNLSSFDVETPNSRFMEKDATPDLRCFITTRHFSRFKIMCKTKISLFLYNRKKKNGISTLVLSNYSESVESSIKKKYI